MNNITDYTKFIVSENEVAQRELAACQNDPVVTELMKLFQLQKGAELIDYYNQNENVLIRQCPHLAVMLFFTCMIQQQRSFEAMTYIEHLKDNPLLPANMYSSLEQYLSFQKTAPDNVAISEDALLDDLKNGKYSPLAVAATLTAIVSHGTDPNDYNRVYRYLLGNPEVSAVCRYQLLDMLVQKHPMSPIRSDFEFKYRNEPARNITIDSDTIAKYDPILVAANTFVGKVEGLNSMSKDALMNFLTLYHYANFGKIFPFRSSIEMEIFVFMILEKICRSMNQDVSILRLDEIPGYEQASAIRAEVDKFFYYFTTDK